jgi:hypothetical protein
MPISLHGKLFYYKISVITWATTVVTKLKIYTGEVSDKQREFSNYDGHT